MSIASRLTGLAQGVSARRAQRRDDPEAPARAAMESGLMTWSEVLSALIIRETRTQFAQQSLGYLWAFITPIAWIGLFVVVFTLMGRKSPINTDIVSFLATGFLGYLSFFRRTFDQVQGAIKANRQLMFVDRVAPSDLAIARSVLGLQTSITVFVVVTLANLLVFRNGEVDQALTVCFGLGLAWGIGASLGWLAAIIGQVVTSLQQILQIVLRPMFWISGLFYTANEIPQSLAQYLWYNPVFHAIEITRNGMFLNYESTLAEAWYPLLWIAATIFIAQIADRIIGRRVL